MGEALGVEIWVAIEGPMLCGYSMCIIPHASLAQRQVPPIWQVVLVRLAPNMAGSPSTAECT